MPGLWRFLYMYILRLGVLDGAAGLEFCKFISVYDYMVALKYRALRRQMRTGQVAMPGTKPANALSVSEGADSVQKLPEREVRERIAKAERPATPVPGPHSRAGALVQASPSDTSRHSPEDFTVAEPRAAVSIVVLTMNEDINIRECLASCAWSDDVHVLDSGSTDNTISLSREWGAKTHFNPFKSFGEQRNWAIDNIPLKYDWVFHLDADERFTPALVRAIKSLVESGPPDAGYYVPNKLMFMDRWLRRSGGYPTYQMRLFHRKRMRFCDYGHGQRELTNGTVGTINEPYLHYAFSKGLTEWFAKHNGYSTLEALQVLDGTDRPSTFGDLFRADRIKRRRAWKELSYKMPLRPWLRLIVMLFLFGGIFEGKAGRTYARMMATYEHMITLKLRLLRSNPAAAKVEMAADPRMLHRPPAAASSTNGQTAADSPDAAVAQATV
jgi:glycosyltransferase involved in cell wall biosynthesis